jgi:CheY-like chemotaxis protein
VAEDIQSNFLLVSALLKKHFHLVNAKNGQEAVEAVKNKHFDGYEDADDGWSGGNGRNT